MPLNNEYKRYFIILQEDDKGYEMAGGKIPTGYAKIEIKNGKGKLTAYAQNLKASDKIDYRMLLIAPVKKAAVDLGRLIVDGNGRGELNVEFDADNVMKSGMEISNFMVAAVSTSTATPLSGYTGREKVHWKNSYHVVNKPKDRQDMIQTQIEEVVTPMQPMPTVQPDEVVAPQMPEPGPGIIGEIVEDAKDIVGNVVEGAKDVVEDFVGDVVEGTKDIVEDVAEGAKNVVGTIKKGIKDVMEYVVEENDVKPVPVEPMEQFIPEQPIAQPIMQAPPVKPKKEPVPIQVVTEPVTMQPVMPAPPVKPKKEPVPIQVVTEPVTMQPVMPAPPVKPKKEPIPVPVVTEPVTIQPIIQPEPIQVPTPEFIPIPMPAPAPIVEKPAEVLVKKPLYEAETEIKAKFVIETEEKHEHHVKPIYACEVQCPEIDYKDFYYEEESERDSDSDSDSDSDDRDKKKKHDEYDMDDNDHDYDKVSYFESPMYRRLEKVLGRLREYEPFEDDDDSREKWYRIEDDIYLLNSAAIPFMGSLMPLGYPYMSNDCVMTIGRKDYIIGVKYERSRKDKKFMTTIMFGIPGRQGKKEEVYYSMRGFMHFKPHKSKNYGYWIMKVDIETGKIIMK